MSLLDFFTGRSADELVQFEPTSEDTITFGLRLFTETAAGSLRIHSDGGMRHSSIPESAPAQGTLISQPCAKVLP